MRSEGVPTQRRVVTPQVKSVQPASGSALGGTEVVITGTGFKGDVSVSFGSTPAKAITATSETQITATSPPGEGTVSVTVISGGVSSRTTRQANLPMKKVQTIWWATRAIPTYAIWISLFKISLRTKNYL